MVKLYELNKIITLNPNDIDLIKLEDLRVVCANCHRKIHGLNITVDKLINIFITDKK